MSEETKEIGEIQKMVKQSKNVGTVRERERERELKFRKDKKIETQFFCVCLRYKDGLWEIVCLFCECDSS